MSSMTNLSDFLTPIDLAQISNDTGYKEGQIGKNILVWEQVFPDVSDADVVLVACGEERGNASSRSGNIGPDAIRHQFYSLYDWHKNVRLADLGNVIGGANLTDTYAALRSVVSELIGAGKTVVILGGSHDLTLAQYDAYKHLNKTIEVTGIDSLINLSMDSPRKSESFLMDMLTGEPNFIRHYNHIGFQSFFVHPHMLETMDKLRFDCYRVGVVKEQIEEMEPVIRNSQMVSFDVAALQYMAAPSGFVSPNGLNGEEACTLMRFAGMSPVLNSLGIYGYSADEDLHQVTSKQIAQMIWYFTEGRSRAAHEAKLTDRESFIEFHTVFAEVDTIFLQSKKTGRWWLQLPNQKFIACSYQDYVQASNDEIPERWLRAQERG